MHWHHYGIKMTSPDKHLCSSEEVSFPLICYSMYFEYFSIYSAYSSFAVIQTMT